MKKKQKIKPFVGWGWLGRGQLSGAVRATRERAVDSKCPDEQVVRIAIVLYADAKKAKLV